MTEADMKFVDRRTKEENSNGLVTQILFWYDEDESEITGEARRRTNAIAVDTTGCLIVSRSICSPKDNFEKNKGRMIATARMFGRAKNHCSVLPLYNSEDMAEEAARVYREAFPDDERGAGRAYNVGKIYTLQHKLDS